MGGIKSSSKGGVKFLKETWKYEKEGDKKIWDNSGKKRAGERETNVSLTNGRNDNNEYK